MRLTEVLQDMCANSALFSDEAFPFRLSVQQGGSDRVMVLAGENASGKSLVFQGLAAWGKREHGFSPITVSIRERTGSGLSEISSFRRTVMFGDEAEQSTGAASVRVVETGFRTAAEWASEDQKKPLLMLDEPEMGLSDGYARALGGFIARQALGLPEQAAGVVIVTHSRNLVEGLVLQLGAEPEFVHMGDENLSLAEWCAHREERAIEDLLALGQKNIDGWRCINRIVNSIRASSDSTSKTPGMR